MRRIAIILGVALVSSCAALLVADNFSGDLVRVPHKKHADAQIACISCHEDVYDATSLDGNFRPLEAKCLECHQDDKDKGHCDKCHSDVKKAGPYPKRIHELKFAHKQHIAATKEDCAVCHRILPDGPNPVRRPGSAPTMEACLGCHTHQADYDKGHCERCHTDLARYPIKPIADFSHGGNYVRQHARDARAADSTCANCHEQTFCADCHARTVATPIELKYSEKVSADFIHRADFVDRHAIEARSDPASCMRCHGTSFCEACHTAQNLTSRGANPRDPHPQGWSFPGSAQFHGVEARRDITQCAACHDQGPRSICIDCHKVGGIGGNPHPTAFTDRHPRAEIQKNGMCLYCHL